MSVHHDHQPVSDKDDSTGAASDETGSSKSKQFLSLLSRFEESYQFVNGDAIDHGPWRKGQSVWVCKSKGRKKSTPLGAAAAGPHRKRTPELFLRARILSVHSNNENDSNDDDKRILVQYPAGSTYRVRRDLLVPILEAQQRTEDESAAGGTQESRNCWVVVYPETNDYRRACVTHTGSTEHFWEIGCAQGITCHRVQQSSGDAAATTTTSSNAGPRRTVVGLDKSKSSIATARQRYPECHFFMADILDPGHEGGGADPDDDNTSSSSSSSNVTRMPTPQVVGVDIGGNRDLEPVLQCLEVVLEQWQPRLVLVKSRALHHCIQRAHRTGAREHIV